MGASFPQPTEEIETARAELLFTASLYTEALKEYEWLLSSHPGSAHIGEWQLGRAKCQVRLRRDHEALESLTASLASPALNAQRLVLSIEVYVAGQPCGGARGAL